MAITVRDLADHVASTLGNRESGGLALLDLVNGWGSSFYTAHQWNFRVRPFVGVDFVADQEWVSMPADFGALIDPQPTNHLQRTAIPTTTERILSMRTSGIPATTSYAYWIAAEYPIPDVDTGPIAPRFTIYPTPNANENDALTIAYMAKWPRLTSDNQYVPIPEFADDCFRIGWRHYVRAYEEEDEGNMAQRMAVWSLDPFTVAAMREDGRTQPSLGPMSGGAVASIRYYQNYDGRVTFP